jgi:IclR family transcriptional regulator, acetate operon repressor
MDERRTAPATEGAVPERIEVVRTGTLARGLAILDVMVSATQPMTLVEIATAAKLDESTTLRILRALENTDRLVRIGEGKRYLPSPAALRPLPLLHPIEQFRREACSFIVDLAREVAKTVVLVAYIAGQRLVIDIAQSSGSLSPYYDNWLRGPLHGSGVGKAFLLALEPDQRRVALGPEPYRAATPNTLTSWEEVSRDLAVAAERGYVMARDEFYVGLTALGANFASWNGRIAGCIAITGHSRDFDDTVIQATADALIRAVKLMPLQAPSLRGLDQLCGR